MKIIQKKPYVFLFISLLFIWAFNYIIYIQISGSALDINIKDTYYVISTRDATILLCSIILIPAITYLLFEKCKIQLNAILTILHIAITVLSILSYPLAYYYYNRSNAINEFPLFDTYKNMNSYIIFIIIMLLIGFGIFILNLVLSLAKHFSKKVKNC